jgi:hypothetical protein
MSLALPNLDDRRWVDLVEEGRSLIPFYSTEWTDHNVHDPGITLIELFAWLAEMDIFQLDRIPERNLRAFLSLIGVRPNPPAAALAVTRFAFRQALMTTPLVRIPPSAELEGVDAFGVTTRFRTLSEIFVNPAALQAIQVKDQQGFHDLTGRLVRDETVEIFGENPSAGAEIYFGFSCAVPVGVPASLVVGADSTATDRTEHHSVRLAWEILVAPDRWQQLSVDNDPPQVADETRSLTASGRILFTLPVAMVQQQIGEVAQPLYYLRSRIVSGAYDAAPTVRSLVLNGVVVEQAVPASSLRLPIAAGTSVQGAAPPVGTFGRFHLRLNARGEIVELCFVEDENVPEFRVLAFSPGTSGAPGFLTLEAVAIGTGDGLPNLRLKLPDAPALEPEFRVFTLENGRWREWTLRQNFNASGRADSHFIVDLMAGVVQFGDGEQGRVPPADASVVVRYDATRAAEGNLTENQISAFADSAHNRALIGGNAIDELNDQLAITNLPATGGAAAETVGHAIGRAIELVGSSGRAVTLADYEALALKTPGTRIARASARANLHPGLPCVTAAGVVTVIVIPYLPLDRPFPSRALLRRVANHLSPRRVIGTRVEVIGPTYVEVTVRAKVKALPGSNKADLQQQILTSLHRFFHPLQGGPNSTGWPLGRDVFHSEVLQVIDETARVDHVISLEISANCGAGQCGNLCLSPNELVASGAHEIELV